MEHNQTVEWCPYCENEVILKNEFIKQGCPACGKELSPCSICDRNHTICTQCPLEHTDVDKVFIMVAKHKEDSSFHIQIEVCNQQLIEPHKETEWVSTLSIKTNCSRERLFKDIENWLLSNPNQQFTQKNLIAICSGSGL